MAVKRASLLGLPPELRSEIYTLVLTIPGAKNEPVRLRTPAIRSKESTSSLLTSCKTWLKGRNRYSVLALLGTCRQIYNEAAGIFYSVNIIELWAKALPRPNDNDVEQFVESVTRRGINFKRVDSLRTLQVRFSRLSDLVSILVSTNMCMAGLKHLTVVHIPNYLNEDNVEDELKEMNFDMPLVFAMARVGPRLETVEVKCTQPAIQYTTPEIPRAFFDIMYGHHIVRCMLQMGRMPPDSLSAETQEKHAETIVQWTSRCGLSPRQLSRLLDGAHLEYYGKKRPKHYLQTEEGLYRALW